MKNNEVQLKMDAAYPEKLMQEKTPEDVWMRLDASHPMGNIISVKGPRNSVHDFILEHWGEEVVEILERNGKI